MRILIAEDTDSARLLLERTLEGWGHEVVATENGAEALAALDADGPSLLIADWMMPEMDGLELTRQIRSRDWGRYIYILMLTALGETDSIAQAMDAGADDYVTKPFARAELKARLTAADRVIGLERTLSERVAELEESLSTIKRLKELLPICMYCKKIRNDNDYWQEIEVYIREQTGSGFSHGICPDCFETVVKPGLEEDERRMSDT